MTKNNAKKGLVRIVSTETLFNIQLVVINRLVGCEKILEWPFDLTPSRSNV